MFSLNVYPLTHSVSKQEWKAAHDNLLLACKHGETSPNDVHVFIVERDGEDDDDFEIRMFAEINRGHTWPTPNTPCTSNVLLYPFEPSDIESQMQDQIFGPLMMKYSEREEIVNELEKKSLPIRDANRLASRRMSGSAVKLSTLFGANIPPKIILTNATDFLVSFTLSSIVDFVREECTELGMSFKTYETLAAEMAALVVQDILYGENDGLDTRTGNALFELQEESIAFNLIRAAWNIACVALLLNVGEKYPESHIHAHLVTGRAHAHYVKFLLRFI